MLKHILIQPIRQNIRSTVEKTLHAQPVKAHIRYFRDLFTYDEKKYLKVEDNWNG